MLEHSFHLAELDPPHVRTRPGEHVRVATLSSPVGRLSTADAFVRGCTDNRIVKATEVGIPHDILIHWFCATHPISSPFCPHWFTDRVLDTYISPVSDVFACCIPCCCSGLQRSNHQDGNFQRCARHAHATFSGGMLSFSSRPNSTTSPCFSVLRPRRSTAVVHVVPSET
jgi:hypothetical protein